jgi:hypothetical protein
VKAAHPFPDELQLGHLGFSRQLGGISDALKETVNLLEELGNALRGRGEGFWLARPKVGPQADKVRPNYRQESGTSADKSPERNPDGNKVHDAASVSETKVKHKFCSDLRTRLEKKRSEKRDETRPFKTCFRGGKYLL